MGGIIFTIYKKKALRFHKPNIPHPDVKVSNMLVKITASFAFSKMNIVKRAIPNPCRKSIDVDIYI